MAFFVPFYPAFVRYCHLSSKLIAENRIFISLSCHLDKRQLALFTNRCDSLKKQVHGTFGNVSRIFRWISSPKLCTMRSLRLQLTCSLRSLLELFFRHRNRSRAFLNLYRNIEEPFLQRNHWNQKPEPLELLHVQTMTELNPTRGYPVELEGALKNQSFVGGNCRR